MAETLHGEIISCDAANAAGQPTTAAYWLTPDHTAIIESASVIGLAMLEPSQRAPLENDSTGLGQIILHATANGAKRLVIGIGGSATNDGGFGMARALGWEFLDSANKPITQWAALRQLRSIKQPLNFSLPPVTVAVDVQNPLLGPEGCTRVYGPQKGFNENDMSPAEDALKTLARTWENQMGEAADQLPGAGAAGGLGFGLYCFLKADLQSGFALFARAVQLTEKLTEADIVITGEGGMDCQTVMGKGVGDGGAPGRSEVDLDHRGAAAACAALSQLHKGYHGRQLHTATVEPARPQLQAAGRRDGGGAGGQAGGGVGGGVRRWPGWSDGDGQSSRFSRRGHAIWEGRVVAIIGCVASARSAATHTWHPP